LVLLNLGKTRSTHNDATPLVFVDLIIRDVVGAVEDYDAVRIVVDVVVLDPAESGLDGKDTL